MNYIIMDLEWNQAISAAKIVRKPVVLNGEIIQIGAVKTDEQFNLIDKIKINVRPRFYKIMNPHVEKLTGITQLQLTAGETFPQAFRRFGSWCGDDFRVITWGSDDKDIFLDNLALHGIEKRFGNDFINLQLIYNSQVQHEHLQTALSAAVESVGITVDVQCHDAFNDAYLTWQLCGKLDMEKGLACYSQFEEKVSAPLFKDTLQQAPNPRRMCRDVKVLSIPCPHCGGKLKYGEWVFQNGKNCKAIAKCEGCGDNGTFIVRLKSMKFADRDYIVIRTLYAASADEIKAIEQKLERRREWKRNNAKKAAERAEEEENNAEDDNV